MKTLSTTLLLTALAGSMSFPATASATRSVPHRFTDQATVIRVDPVFREVAIREPRQECWIEEQRHIIREQPARRLPSSRQQHQGGHGGDVLVGGIIGGVIGNQLGRHGNSSARTGATVAGAIIGSALASNRSQAAARHRREPVQSYTPPRETVTTRPVERCETRTQVRYEERIEGYDVTYRYQGETFTTRMNRDPGRRLDVQVTVQPARGHRSIR